MYQEYKDASWPTLQIRVVMSKFISFSTIINIILFKTPKVKGPENPLIMHVFGAYRGMFTS